MWVGLVLWSGAESWTDHLPPAAPCLRPAAVGLGEGGSVRCSESEPGRWMSAAGYRPHTESTTHLDLEAESAGLTD